MFEYVTHIDQHGPYNVVLGSGSYASVYLVRDVSNPGSPVEHAMKMVDMSRIEESDDEREATLTELAILVAAQPEKRAVVEMVYYDYIKDNQAGSYIYFQRSDEDSAVAGRPLPPDGDGAGAGHACRPGRRNPAQQHDRCQDERNACVCLYAEVDRGSKVLPGEVGCDPPRPQPQERARRHGGQSEGRVVGVRAPQNECYVLEISDFGLASAMTEHNSKLFNPENLTFFYTAPEIYAQGLVGAASPSLSLLTTI